MPLSPLEALAHGTPADKLAAIADLGEPRDAVTAAALAAALEDAGYVDVEPPSEAHFPRYVAIAERAAEALGRGGAVAVPALAAMVASRSSELVPVPSEDQGQYIGDYGSRPIYAAELAARALAKIGVAAKPAAQALAARLSDSAYEVSVAALAALAVVGAPDGPNVAAALSALVRRAGEDRDRMVDAVGLLGAVAVPALVSALTDPSDGVREKAAAALGRIGPAAGDAVAPLAALLSEGAGPVRFVAAWALGHLGDAARVAVPELTATLADGYARLPAAESLTKLGESLDAVRRVAEELAAKDGQHRARAQALLASLRR